MPTIIGAGDPTTGYDVENSLRFNLVDDTDLVQTFGSAGNRRTWTFSAWIKRGRTAVRQQIFHQYGATDNNQWVEFRFDSDDKLTFSWYSSGVFTTSQVFRDIASWYHIVLAVDTTQGTDSDRIKLYVNGSQVTSFGSITYPSQNYDTGMNQATAHSLGHLENNGNFNFDGYMAEVNLVDGTQLTPTSFGETNDNGVWVPIKPTGINYGTNGYYLEFQNRASYTIPTARFSNDSDTQLLINSGAADGNTSFTDSSSNGISITANGNVHHESDVAKFSTSSIYFDGNGDYLEAADNSVYDFGTGDFTVEMWLYPTDLNDYDGIYFFGSGTNQHTLWLRADGNLRWAHVKAAGDGNTIDTTFNNTYLLENAWNHVAVVRESQVLRIAINGVITGQTQSTSGFSISLSGLKIGVEADNNRYYTGYMDCFRISDTARYTVSSSSNFGTDTSGNGKHFTSTNFAPHQQCVDVPTNNFFVMNSLGTIGVTNQQATDQTTFTNGNTEMLRTRSTGESDGAGTSISALPQNGKWYWEIFWASRDTNNMWQGIVNHIDASTNVIYYSNNGNKYINGSASSYGNSYNMLDTIGVAVNMDDDEVIFYKNGTAQDSGTAISNSRLSTHDMFVYMSDGGGSDGPNAKYNFGNPSYEKDFQYTDANGYGKFQYSVPSGYYALCSKNIGEFG